MKESIAWRKFKRSLIGPPWPRSVRRQREKHVETVYGNGRRFDQTSEASQMTLRVPILGNPFSWFSGATDGRDHSNKWVRKDAPSSARAWIVGGLGTRRYTLSQPGCTQSEAACWCSFAELPQGKAGGQGETWTLTAINRWNLNPVRLPISPLARVRRWIVPRQIMFAISEPFNPNLGQVRFD